MRKIKTTIVLDPISFEMRMQVLVRDENDNKVKFETTLRERKYTAAQRELIALVNGILTENEQDFLTEEEIEFLLRPISTEEPTEEEIQALAGFKVEKKIIYTDKQES